MNQPTAPPPEITTCPTCRCRTADPDDRIENGAWYCGDCDMFRIPAADSDLDRETRTLFTFVAFTEDRPRPKLRLIAGEQT